LHDVRRESARYDAAITVRPVGRAPEPIMRRPTVRTFSHLEVPAGGGRHRADTPVVSDFGFYAAHRLAHDDWRDLAAGEAEAARLLAETRALSRPGRSTFRQRGPAAFVVSLRRTIGAVLIAAGRRVQGRQDAVTVDNMAN
jgi:hypothetical protein